MKITELRDSMTGPQHPGHERSFPAALREETSAVLDILNARKSIVELMPRGKRPDKSEPTG